MATLRKTSGTTRDSRAWTIPNTGAPTRGTGLLVTSTLLFGGEGGAAPVLRAWDKKTGAVVAEIQMPGPTTGFPVTYTKAGRQYIAVAVRAGDAVEIVALALPAATSQPAAAAEDGDRKRRRRPRVSQFRALDASWPQILHGGPQNLPPRGAPRRSRFAATRAIRVP